jgi:hypothetical protein
MNYGPFFLGRLARINFNLDPASTLQFSRCNAEKLAGSAVLSESGKFLFDMN